MNGFGSGDYGEFTFLDYLNIVSFIIGLENLQLNLTQEDIDRQTADLDASVNNRIHEALMDLHNHLQEQDKKIDELLRRIKR